MNKKIVYLASLTMGLLSLSSCEENDDFDANYVIPNYFTGTWELTQTGSLNADNNVLYYDDVIKAENCEFDNVVLGADMSFTENDYTFATACELESFAGKYAVSDGNIVLTYNDEDPTDEIDAETATFDVIALTNTNMELSYTDESGELVFLKFTKA
jgi:hypothetical protein